MLYSWPFQNPARHALKLLIVKLVLTVWFLCPTSLECVRSFAMGMSMWFARSLFFRFSVDAFAILFQQNGCLLSLRCNRCKHSLLPVSYVVAQSQTWEVHTVFGVLVDLRKDWSSDWYLGLNKTRQRLVRGSSVCPKSGVLSK